MAAIDLFLSYSSLVVLLLFKLISISTAFPIEKKSTSLLSVDRLV